jgi:hypothetical protein
MEGAGAGGEAAWEDGEEERRGRERELLEQAFRALGTGAE